MAFEAKKVLIVGATSGIGLAFASRLVSNGIFVIVAGRRKEKLETFVQTNGKDKTDAFQVDITDLDQLPSFTSAVTQAHPDLDCVFINAGIQRGFDFTDPLKVDFASIQEELTTNYVGPVKLTTAILPHLQQQQRKTYIIYTSSQLGLVPMVRCPNYGASKAALHHFILALREQLKRGPGKVGVVEVFPPAVQTELHDEKHQPDLKNGGDIGMPLEEFTDGLWDGLKQNKEQIPIGTAEQFFGKFENSRQESFQQLSAAMDELLKPFLK